MNTGTGTTVGNPGIYPIPFTSNNEILDSGHDQYDVYVNDQMVGRKTLYSNGDQLSDLDDFLQTQGMLHFTSELVGDHYIIQTDSANSNDITQALSVYFHNR